MRSHISVHRVTTKYFSNSFVFKTEIEKEGLPGDITPALGAGALTRARKDGPVRFVGPPDWPVLSAKHQGPIESWSIWGPERAISRLDSGSLGV